MVGKTPTNPWGFPTKNDQHLGCEMGGKPTIYGNTHMSGIYCQLGDYIITYLPPMLVSGSVMNPGGYMLVHKGTQPTYDEKTHPELHVCFSDAVRSTSGSRSLSISLQRFGGPGGHKNDAFRRRHQHFFIIFPQEKQKKSFEVPPPRLAVLLL